MRAGVGPSGRNKKPARSATCQVSPPPAGGGGNSCPAASSSTPVMRSEASASTAEIPLVYAAPARRRNRLEERRGQMSTWQSSKETRIKGSGGGGGEGFSGWTENKLTFEFTNRRNFLPVDPPPSSSSSSSSSGGGLSFLAPPAGISKPTNRWGKNTKHGAAANSSGRRDPGSRFVAVAAFHYRRAGVGASG